MYGSKSVQSDFENKKPLNSKHYYLNFLPLNLTLTIFNKSFSPLFFNVKNVNLNIFNVPKFNMPKSAAKFNV